MSGELASARTLTHEEWLARGEELYGPRGRDWKFRCVACGHVQSAVAVVARNPAIELLSTRDWIYFSCEGRRTASVGCDWTLGGLFTLHSLEVVDDGGVRRPAFEFADDPVGEWSPFKEGGVG